MIREIINIDEEKCNGCGLCIPNCPEGALQVIDGKARLISDLFCDGLGACIGECPAGAITIEEREAQSYDERRVMENVIAQGEGVVQAHLTHLQEHGEQEYLQQALAVLEEKEAQIGVILLDLALPGMDGFEFFETIRADPLTAGIPVVAVTALGRESHTRSLEAGMDGYLSKPFTLKQLKEVLIALGVLAPNGH